MNENKQDKKQKQNLLRKNTIKTFFIILGLILVSVCIVEGLVNIPVVTVADEKTWVGFYGACIGALIGAFALIYVTKKQLLNGRIQQELPNVYQAKLLLKGIEIFINKKLIKHIGLDINKYSLEDINTKLSDINSAINNEELHELDEEKCFRILEFKDEKIQINNELYKAISNVYDTDILKDIQEIISNIEIYNLSGEMEQNTIQNVEENNIKKMSEAIENLKMNVSVEQLNEIFKKIIEPKRKIIKFQSKYENWKTLNQIVKDINDVEVKIDMYIENLRKKM